MSARKVLFDLSKRISHISIPKVRSRIDVRTLFTTEKLEINDKKIEPAPEKLTINNERWDNQPRTDLSLRETNNNNQQATKQLDLRSKVVKNMENGKFSTKVLNARPTIHCETSIAGSDVLITWYQFEGSMAVTRMLGREIYDTKTGIRRKIEDQGGDLMLTHSYIISRSAGCWKVIHNRSTNEKTVNLPYGMNYATNLDPTMETLVIAGSDKFYLIDLETGQFQEFDKPNDEVIGNVQLYGTYIAYTRYFMNKMTLRVIDAKLGKEILKKEYSKHGRYCLMKGQIALAEFDKDKITWSIIDLNGRTTNQGNFETTALPHLYLYPFGNTFSYKNFLIINHGPFLYFVDILSGRLLTTLAAFHGLNRVSGYDEGKFTIATDYSIYMVDFESPDPSPDRPVKAVVINPNETISTRTGTINELVNGLIYSEDLKNIQAAQSNTYDSKMWHSLIVHSSATERVTLVHFEFKQSKTDNIITRITNSRTRRQDYNREVRPVMNVKKNFYGRGLLYKEELIDGKWVPVDLSVQQVEEFINSEL